MPIPGAIIIPHPPLILPEVGRGEERSIAPTTRAYQAAAAEVAAWKPDVVIITSPHTMLYRNYFHISPGASATGNMARFRAPQVRFDVRYDTELRKQLIRFATDAGLSAGTEGERDPSLDHGVMVPLYFLRQAGVSCPILRIGLSGFPPQDHYRLGQCIAAAAESLGRRAVFVASGDLSHKLRPEGPYGFAPEGPVFDEQVTACMASGDFLGFLSMDPSLADRAAECGLRSFQIMAGFLDGLAVHPHLYVHQDVTGVGYAVASFQVTGPDSSRQFAERYLEGERKRLEDRKAAEDPWVRLARLSLETWIRNGKKITTLPAGLPEELSTIPAGVFVSLHIRNELRGCIGTIYPCTPSVGMEIIANAISAGTRDYRFAPVREEELDQLEYNVDVLGAPEPVSSPTRLDPKRYGVIVTCGNRRGLLLPDLDGINTVDQQIKIAMQKGGIHPGENYSLMRFEVVRHR